MKPSTNAPASPSRVSIHEMRLEDRPREKALREGVRRLSDEELLAILIGSGTREGSALDVARTLLAKYEGHLDLLYRDFIENVYPKVSGMGQVKLVSVAAGMELGMRATRGLVDPLLGASHEPAGNSLKIYEYIAEKLTGLVAEQVWLLCFNSQNSVKYRGVITIKGLNELLDDRRESPAQESAAEEGAEDRRRGKLPVRLAVSSGGYQETTVDVRLILREALSHHAVRIALVHNHPGGSLRPSADDDRLTWRLWSACEIIGIPLIDHLIYTDHGYYSYFDHDRLRGE